MSDAENILQTIKTTVQDIVAPDARELKVRMSALEGRMSGLESQKKCSLRPHSGSQTHFKA